MTEQAFSLESETDRVAVATDRRIEVRYATHVSAACCDLLAEHSQGKSWEEASVRDVSTRGIGFRVAHAPAPDELVVLHVAWMDHLLWASVAHVSELPDGRHFVGCQFIEPLTDLELEALQ
jgi:hypothetical protein